MLAFYKYTEGRSSQQVQISPDMQQVNIIFKNMINQNILWNVMEWELKHNVSYLSFNLQRLSEVNLSLL